MYTQEQWDAYSKQRNGDVDRLLNTISLAANLIDYLISSPSFQGWKHPQQAEWYKDIKLIGSMR